MSKTLRELIRDSVWTNVRISAENSVWTNVRISVRNRVWKSVCNRIGDSIGNSVMYNVRISVRNEETWETWKTVNKKSVLKGLQSE